jgi:uncharacterized protein (DUF433 family)
MTFARITHNPAMMGGKPCVRGLRVTVGIILGLPATGEPRERILAAYPYLNGLARFRKFHTPPPPFGRRLQGKQGPPGITQPHLEPADRDECLAYAAWRLEEREEGLVAP